VEARSTSARAQRAGPDRQGGWATQVAGSVGAKWRSGDVILYPRINSGLFLTVFLGMSLRRLLTMISGVSRMSSRRVGMVCALLMVSGVVVLGRFTVMVRSVRMVF
jgi:hypothetical protein